MRLTPTIPELDQRIDNGEYQGNDAFEERVILYSSKRAEEDGEEKAYFSQLLGWTSRAKADRIRPNTKDAIALLTRVQGYTTIDHSQNWSKGLGRKAVKATELFGDVNNST